MSWLRAPLLLVLLWSGCTDLGGSPFSREPDAAPDAAIPDGPAKRD